MIACACSRLPPMPPFREQTLQDIKFLLCVLIGPVVLGLFLITVN